MSDVRRYLLQPWTIRSSHVDGSWVLEIVELPGFFAAGRTPEETEANFWEALESHLASYVKRGVEPPEAGPRVRTIESVEDDRTLRIVMGVPAATLLAA